MIMLTFYLVMKQVSVLRNEKEMLVSAEKRACDEVRGLSQRVHRLQVGVMDFLLSTTCGSCLI